MSNEKFAPSEVVESLTGFDEIAIRSAFGFDPYTDAESHPIQLLRALVFVLKRREGMNDNEAKAFALGLTLAQTNDHFTDEAEEIDPDDPDTESGKGGKHAA